MKSNIRNKFEEGEVIRNQLKIGTLEKIINPINFFDNNIRVFDKVVEIVRNAFGSNMTEEDIYSHLIQPEKVYLIRDFKEELIGMSCYTTLNINNEKALYVDGIVISPNLQHKGLFNLITEKVIYGEKYVALRTQNPRMYKALEKYCSEIYPNNDLDFSENLTPNLLNSLASKLNMDIDEKSVARNFYGTSLYGSEPKHETVSNLFKDILNVNFEKGDSVLCLGVRN